MRSLRPGVLALASICTHLLVAAPPIPSSTPAPLLAIAEREPGGGVNLNMLSASGECQLTEGPTVEFLQGRRVRCSFKQHPYPATGFANVAGRRYAQVSIYMGVGPPEGCKPGVYTFRFSCGGLVSAPSNPISLGR